MAAIDADGTQHFNPGPDFVIGDGSVLVSIGPPEGQARLRAASGPEPQTTAD